MKIIRGKLKGQEVELHQFCNDWMSLNLADGLTKIVSPTSVQLTTNVEFSRMNVSRGARSAGTFWREFELKEDGTFKKLRWR